VNVLPGENTNNCNFYAGIGLGEGDCCVDNGVGNVHMSIIPVSDVVAPHADDCLLQTSWNSSVFEAPVDVLRTIASKASVVPAWKRFLGEGEESRAGQAFHVGVAQNTVDIANV